MAISKLGNDVINSESVLISDVHRQSGLYVLGKPGMGKTTLLVNLMKQDIQNNHGLFFLDPHGDAIKDLLKSMDRSSLEDKLLIIDPEDDRYSFGINLLACKDLSSMSERGRTYTRAYNIFHKIWEDSWGVWLQLIIQNALYVFLENPDYTLADMPLFFEDVGFRNHLLKKVLYSPEVVHFWQNSFGAKKSSDQQDQVQSALTRLYSLLNHQPVRDIVGQKQTTLDLGEIMERGKILLVHLSASLAPDMKKFIGTILISELLYAAMNRPESKRHQFCIFVDEFQNFASSEDFSTLITQARKYGIATTIAHQERYGQFLDNKVVAGATAAAANKIYFQLTVKDAQELAPELANQPPTEKRREQQLVVSQYPFSDILRGHINPQIQEFVNKFLRPLKERIDEVKEDIEYQRLVRDHYRDQAALDRVDAQMGSLGRRREFDEAFAALDKAKSNLEKVNQQTAIILGLYEDSKRFRATINTYNHFFPALMEGRVAPGHETFSNFLIGRVHDASLVPTEHLPVLELFIKLQYGGARLPRAIPFNLAGKYGLFNNEVKLLTNEASDRNRQRNQAIVDEITKKGMADYNDWCQKYSKERFDKLRPELLSHRDGNNRVLREHELLRDRHVWRPDNVYVSYVWYLAYPEIQKIVNPYLKLRFDPDCRWKKKLSNINKLISRIIWTYNPRFGLENNCDICNCKKIEDCKDNTVCRAYYNSIRYSCGRFDCYVDDKIVQSLTKVFTEHGEGAFVGLSLIAIARKGAGEVFIPPHITTLNASQVYSDILELNKFMSSHVDYNVFVKYFDRAHKYNFIEKIKNYHYLYVKTTQADLIEDIKGYGQIDFTTGYISLRNSSEPAYKFLVDTIDKRWDWLDKNYSYVKPIYNSLPIIHRSLLIARAVDLARGYGDISTGEYRNVVDAFVSLFNYEERQMLNEMKNEVQKIIDTCERNSRSRIDKLASETIAQSSQILPPDTLGSRVLQDQEIEVIKKACISELQKGDWNSEVTLAVIDHFVKFCELLSRPENHIKVPTGQYIEREVPSRTFTDMTAEMSWELSNLPRFVAYVKILTKQPGYESVIKKKIKTLPLSISDNNYVTNLWQYGVSQAERGYCCSREAIAEEIIRRRNQWRVVPKQSEDKVKPKDSKPVEPVRKTESPVVSSPPQESLKPSRDEPPPQST